MWRNTIRIEVQALEQFEKQFHFKMHPAFKDFLLLHNAGYPSPGKFLTDIKERRLARFLDFSDNLTEDGAFGLNRRLRDKIGPKRIIVGMDISGSFICLERDHKQQFIVVWSHITGSFERCLLDIPMFLRQIG